VIDLSIAIGNYDRHQPLKDGRVRPEGVNLQFAMSRTRDIFYRMLQYQDFDVAEMSMSSYSIGLAQGRRDFIAIPVFPSRFFRHGCIYVHNGSGIERPEDLKGKIVGTPEYHMTANVWIRGLLADDYGVQASDVEWVTGGAERVTFDLDPAIRLRQAESQRAVEEAFERGEIQAMFSAAAPEPIVRKSPHVRALFSNVQHMEEDYFRRTGIFPIMHTIVLRREIYDQHPWIARNLFDSFLEAKRLVLHNLRGPNALPYTMPSLMHYLEQQRAVFGDDPWPYGVEQNLPTLTALQRYLEQQGLVRTAPSFKEMFAANCLGEADPHDRKQA
jgi:4,5-dihydroxyphthalate decarboxylase